MLTFLKLLGILLLVLLAVFLAYGAVLAYAAVGDAGPAWMVGGALLLLPLLLWLVAKFRKIKW